MTVARTPVQCAQSRSSTRPGRGSTGCAGSRIRTAKRVDAAEQGRARARRRRRGLGRGADDPARQGARELRRAVGGHAAARDDRHASTTASRRRSRSPTRTSSRCSRRRRSRSTASARLRATFCGLRVLPGGDGETANARRETVYSTGPSGMVSVAGGKLTTYRRIALDALDHLGVRGLSTTAAAAARARPASTGSRGRWSSTRRRARTCIHLYGSLAPEVLAPAVDDPSLLEPLVPGRPDLRAQDALRADARVGAERRGRPPAPHDGLARGSPPPGLGSAHADEIPTADDAARPRRWRAAPCELGRGARPRRGRLPQGARRRRADGRLQLLQGDQRAELRHAEVLLGSCSGRTTSTAATEPDTRPASSVWRRCSVQVAGRAPTRRLAAADLIVLWGSNAREAHPIFFHHVLKADERRREAHGRRPAADAVRAVGRPLARARRRHRHPARERGRAGDHRTPGSRTWSSSGARRPGFEAFRESVEPWTLEEAERVTGVPADAIRELAHAYGNATNAQLCWTLGITEHHNAVDNVFALINLALLTGKVGKWGSGLQPLRGQNNVQGGGDMGAIPNKLPGFQDILDDGGAREVRGRVGRVDPTRAGLHLTGMFEAMEHGELRAVYVVGENPAQGEADQAARRAAADRARPPRRAGPLPHAHGPARRRRAARGGDARRGRREPSPRASAACSACARRTTRRARRATTSRSSTSSRGASATTSARRARRTCGTSCARSRRCTRA